MKFRGHESFYIRQGWLTKGLLNLQEHGDLFFLDKKEQTDLLGIGSNMTKALRYWLEAFNIIDVIQVNRKFAHILTPFGELIWNKDKFVQENDTLWLLHYQLATGIEKSTSWYWLFNEFEVSEFTEDEFLRNIDFFAKQESKVAESSLKGDFRCILKTYVSEKIEEYESNMFSPLADLNFIKEHDRKKNVYVINKHPLSVSSEVVFYTILDQYEKGEYTNASKEINIERLNSDKNNVGKIYNLSWNAINEHLDVLSKKSLINVVRTAGLDVINIKYEGSSMDYLASVYEMNVG